jgi:hypothetical protein
VSVVGVLRRGRFRLGRTITTTVLDISNVSAVQDWIADTVSHFGRLDGAANLFA